MFKSVVKPSIVVFLMTFIIVNIIYSVTHYGPGSVMVPEWYMKDNERYLFEPMPSIQFIHYWVKRGIMFSAIYGAITSILTFVFTMLNYRKSQHVVLSKNPST